MKVSLFNWFIRVQLLVVAVVFAVALWMLIFPQKVVAYNQPIELLNEGGVINRGEPILLRHDYCVLHKADAKASYQLRNGFVVSYPDINVRLSQKGCYKSEAATLVVPDYVSPGEHTLVLRAWYKANPLKTIYLEVETAPFTVE